MPVGKQSIQRATRALKNENAGTASKAALPAEASVPETPAAKKPVASAKAPVKKAAASAKAPVKKAAASAKAPVKKAAAPAKKKPGRKPAGTASKAALPAEVSVPETSTAKTYMQVSRMHCELPTYLL